MIMEGARNEGHLRSTGHLVVQLWGNPKEEVHVEGVVVSDEGLSTSTSRDHVEYWGLNLGEEEPVEQDIW